MKLFEKFILIFFLLLGYYSTTQAQLVYEQVSTLHTSIERYTLNNVYWYTFAPIDHLYAGFQDSEPYDNNLFRLRYAWNLSSIPSNATIQSIELRLQGKYESDFPSSYTQTYVYIKKFESDFNDYTQTSWDYMTNATTLFSQYIPRTITNFDFTKSFTPTDAFSTYVKSKFGGYLYISVLGDDQSFFTGSTKNVLDFINGQVKIKITYTVPASNITFTADNNFVNTGGANHGTMSIDGGQPQTVPLSGISITRLTGTNLQLGANSPQNDNLNHQMIWHTGATAYSEWKKDGVPKNPNQNYSFTVQSDDNNSTYVANLRKNYLINRINQTEFDGNQTLPGYIVEQNSGQVSTYGNGYTPGTIPYNFVYWTDNLSTATNRTVTPPDNSNYYAMYKASHKSNQTNAYSNPSQRKFIQTPDGVKHICYESMNRVWLEHSTDNGATWFLGNGGKPLSSVDSKNPSMSYYGNQLGIVWQEKNGSSFKIKIALFWMNNYQSSLFGTVVDESALNYSYNSNPVIAWGYNGKVVVVWSGFDMCENIASNALKYAYGSASSNGISWLTQCAIPNTDANSINPTIIADYTISATPFYYYLAWEQVVNTTTSKIYYDQITQGSNNYLSSTSYQEISYPSGYSKNYQPSILLRKVNTNSLPYVTWLGYRSTPSSSTSVISRYKQSGSWSSFSVYGNSLVQSFSINNAGYQYYQDILGLGWSESVSQGVPVYVNKAMKIGGSSTISTLTTTGRDIQINNSNGTSGMYVNSFKNSTLPYFFSLSQPFSSLGKENSLSIFNGREGIVGKDEAQFFFALGDISVNGQNINFIPVPDSVSIKSLETLNSYFESEPFTVNSNSNLIYGVQYGITDSSLCSAALIENENIGFRVELVDATTNELLGTYDEVTYTAQNVFKYSNIGYQVNLSGIGERTIKFRLVTNTNAAVDFSLANRFADQSTLAKNQYQQINYQGNLAVTDYALEQNYPNPFNPSTTIKFQLPNDGMVTLKIYDILGNEITTLINEQKPQGRYEVNFNASSFASGVYIYKIQSGDFVSSKKMILLK